MKLSDLAFGDLLTRLAAKEPAPGGGAAAGMAGATACGLASMVVNYSIGRKSLAEHEGALREHLAWFERLRAILLGLAEEDALAFPALQAAQKMDDADPAKPGSLARATAAAIGAPMAMLAASGDLLARLEPLPGLTNPHLASDLAIAAVLGEAGATAAAWNVRVNLGLIEDEARRAEVRAEVERLVREAKQRRATIERACG